MRFDSVWAVDIDNYVRPFFGSGAPPLYDPAVTAVLKMPRVLWAAVSARPEEFEAKMSKGLQEALHIAPDRIKVLNSKKAPPGAEGVWMEFTLLDGEGPAPSTLLDALFRQVMFVFGAIHQGLIKDEVEGATIERIGPVPISIKHQDRFIHTPPVTDGFFRVTLVLAFVLLASCSLCFFVRSKNSLKKLKEENRRLRDAELRHREMMGNAPVANATGYVIGRPDPLSQGSPSRKDPDARDTTGSLSYVVGNPIQSTSPNAAMAVEGQAMESPELQLEEFESATATVRAPTRVGTDPRADSP